MTRKQCLLQCFLSHKSSWFCQNFIRRIICLKNHIVLHEIKILCEWYLLQKAQPCDIEVKGEWGDFQMCRRIFPTREHLFTPRQGELSSISCQLLPSHFPKWPFLLLPLKEEEPEFLGWVRLSLVCLGGIIHCSRVTDHSAQMGCWLNLGFSFELLHEVYGTRYSLKQAKIGLICQLRGALPLLSAHPLQLVPKPTVNRFTELIVKPLATHP